MNEIKKYENTYPWINFHPDFKGTLLNLLEQEMILKKLENQHGTLKQQTDNEWKKNSSLPTKLAIDISVAEYYIKKTQKKIESLQDEAKNLDSIFQNNKTKNYPEFERDLKENLKKRKNFLSLMAKKTEFELYIDKYSFEINNDPINFANVLEKNKLNHTTTYDATISRTDRKGLRAADNSVSITSFLKTPDSSVSL
ncbi:MAG: hypothetical protein GY710_05645 [Desulfobacteraceae bacterium]|nr:hypothetical protein [Desulfobacteraceae bacterium]